MIPRYSRPEMVAIWSPETKFRIWFEIEAHAADAQAALGVIPKAAAEAIWKAKGVEFNVARIDEIEAVTRHDVIAFLTHLAEIVGDEARFVHQGMTSSDVLDTCLNVQLTRAADILLADLDALLAALKRRAFEQRDTVTIGRSHGIHAEPTTFGLKLAQAYAEFDRGRARLVAARAEVATCAISGAVGTFANIDPAVEAHVAEKLGLRPEPVSTQVIPRDRHAMFFATLGVIASSMERLAVEIRHLQRTEVLEAEEYFSPGQKGSSAMPHKRNPVLTENLTGLARLVRMAVVPAMENVALWHERDISHSSVERGIADEPFWPAEKNSSASSTSVRCMWRISMAMFSMLLAMTPSVAKNIAWRSRGITWVETGSGVRPILAATCSSTAGSILAKVPTAPEIAQVATSIFAASSRALARANSA